MAGPFELFGLLLRKAHTLRENDAGGDTGDDEARRLRSESLEDELDEMEDED